MTKRQGWVKLYRKMLDSEIWLSKPDKWLKIWWFIVLKANHDDSGQFNKGEAFLKYEWIMESTKATRNEVDHCIRWLKEKKQISTKKATRGFYVKVLKYKYYQERHENDTFLAHLTKAGDNESETETGSNVNTSNKNKNNIKSKSDSKSEVKATQKRHRSDTINKNDKELRNKYKYFKNETFKESYNDFKAMRKSKRNAPLTDKGEILVLNKLHKVDVKTAISMLEASTENGWSSVYPRKEEVNGLELLPKFKMPI